MLLTTTTGGFPLNRLKFIVYFTSIPLRHPDDGREYDRNMLVITNMQ
jgi:hypothetical protein